LNIGREEVLRLAGKLEAQDVGFGQGEAERGFGRV
jgi:hypothetical protein